MNWGKLVPARIPILYSILAVLILVGVVPLSWYGTKVVGINKERLKTNEKLLQNTVTSSLADDITQRQNNLPTSLDNLSSAIQVASGNNLSGEHVSTPELRSLRVSCGSIVDTLAYA